MGEQTEWDFQKGRDSDMLRMRQDFVKYLEDFHDQTLAQHSDMTTRDAEADAHAEWDDAQRQNAKRKKADLRTPCPACEACE